MSERLESYYIEYPVVKAELLQENNKYTYIVSEPEIESKEVYDSIVRLLDMTDMHQDAAVNLKSKPEKELYLYNKIKEIAKPENITPGLIYNLRKEYVEEQFLTPFINDPQVTEIEVTPDTFELQHKSVSDSVVTDVEYSEDELAQLIIMLFQKAGEKITSVQGQKEIEYNDFLISACLEDPLFLEVKKL